MRSCETRAELVVCGRAVMRDARPSLFIFAVLFAVLRSGFILGTPWLAAAAVEGATVTFFVSARTVF